ncbi:unnamed protein product [Microthlaspi erraticum]|uniref:F-box domain-containing protein n=1 Tax=Microthlaspi erraticum TaxID=1685480 RepID=A0A6D2JNQ8_9BRAS|nr:unnamed protein product [Microthlaspi erraticum]
MTNMSDLSEDLVMEILYRVPMTSLKPVRSTCKNWNTLSKHNIFGKSVAKKEFLGFVPMDFKICSLRFNLQGIRDDGDFIGPSIKQISMLEILRVYHCDGLLLCVTMQPSRVVVWNPYLGQTRWILPITNLYRYTTYAFGYQVDNRNKNHHQHKILRFSNDYCLNVGNHVSASEIYDFSSDAWRVIDVSPEGDVQFHTNDVSLKGNTYFFAQEKVSYYGGVEVFLLCFDFTRERFGSRLSVPFRIRGGENVTLSCVGEEQVAVLHHSLDLFETMEVWVTTKIEPNAVSWSKFLKVDRRFEIDVQSFFIDEEKKIAVVFGASRPKQEWASRYQVAYIIGEDGYLKSVSLHLGLHDKLYNGYCHPFVCSSYIPSLVQVQINQEQKIRY